MVNECKSFLGGWFVICGPVAIRSLNMGLIGRASVYFDILRSATRVGFLSLSQSPSESTDFFKNFC